MVWTYYPLKFRLLSPMHIGYRKVGNLMQTRQYVPGKNLWAALTARITRDYLNGSDANSYKKVGEYAIDKFRFGYLWPSLDGDKPCFYWDREDFDYLFLDSYASTALDYSACSTEEGSLHETEFIAPVARNGKPVYLLGDLWVNEGAKDKIDDESWQRSMENLQLGGERTYGWGRLALCLNEWNGKIKGSGKTVVGHPWRVEGKEIVVTLNEGEIITAHALAAVKSKENGQDLRYTDEITPQSGTSASTKDVAGPVEPMVGREWSAFAGQKVCYSGVYFSPGSKVIKREARFIIDPFGRWVSH